MLAETALSCWALRRRSSLVDQQAQVEQPEVLAEAEAAEAAHRLWRATQQGRTAQAAVQAGRLTLMAGRLLLLPLLRQGLEDPAVAAEAGAAGWPRQELTAARVLLAQQALTDR